MNAAYVYADLSYAKRRQVGCVVVQDDRIISIGYNGTPSGEDNCCEDEHNVTLPSVIHAEDNAIRKLNDASITPSDQAVLFVTTAPCRRCSDLILNANIRKVVYDEIYHSSEGISHLQAHGVVVEQIEHYKNN